MGGKTNLQVVSFATALTVFIMAFASFYAKDFMAQVPSGFEAGITGIITAVIGFFAKGNAGIKALPGTGDGT